MVRNFASEAGLMMSGIAKIWLTLLNLFSAGIGGDCGIVGHDLVQAIPLYAIFEAEALSQLLQGGLILVAKELGKFLTERLRKECLQYLPLDVTCSVPRGRIYVLSCR